MCATPTLRLGPAATAELHLSDLYSDFEGQDSADSAAASSQLQSGENSSETPINAQVSSAAATDGGQLLLPSGSAESSGGMYAAFTNGTLPGTALPPPGPPPSQRGDPSGDGDSSDAPPIPRQVSLRGEDIYAAFDAADGEQSGPQPTPTPPPAALPLQRPPQPPPRPLAKSLSSKDVSQPQPRSFRQSSDQLGRPRPSCDQPQPRRFRQSSEQLQLGGPRASCEQPQRRSFRQSSDQLGRPRQSSDQLQLGKYRQSCDQPRLSRPRPSCDGWRSQPPQQRMPLTNGHAARTSADAGSKGGRQPAPAALTASAQGSEATYAVYRKYHQAHPLPLPPPLAPLPELPPLDAAAPPAVCVKDATYDDEDAFTVYTHFADGSAPQRAPKAEDGSYAGEDAYSVYGRFVEEAQPAATEGEHDLYTDFAYP